MGPSPGVDDNTVPFGVECLQKNTFMIGLKKVQVQRRQICRPGYCRPFGFNFAIQLIKSMGAIKFRLTRAQ